MRFSIFWIWMLNLFFWYGKNFSLISEIYKWRLWYISLVFKLLVNATTDVQSFGYEYKLPHISSRIPEFLFNIFIFFFCLHGTDTEKSFVFNQCERTIWDLSSFHSIIWSCMYMNHYCPFLNTHEAKTLMSHNTSGWFL
jgi:hypothetical protein